MKKKVSSQSLLPELKTVIDCLLSAHNHLIIGIDGRCGSGKTTIAAGLAGYYDSMVIHMDDFYLPFDRRTEERLAEPGGNVDYERFMEEVFLPLMKWKDSDYQDSLTGEYRLFSCSSGTFDQISPLSPHTLIIIEGSYSMRPELRKLYDYSMFLHITPKAQAARLIHRVGPEHFHNFQAKWIPMEEMYFDHYKVMEACDTCFKIEI